MRVLPTTTRPPAARIERRHQPRPGRWDTYRPCLRWEFGFTCAFCLLHEADLAEHGIERTGLAWIEHYVPRSEDASLKHVYENCFYACKYCNRARGDALVLDAEGRRLLNPCAAPWAQHFAADGDSLRPRSGDRDAEYTHSAYDLDDPVKQTMRAGRREQIHLALRTIGEGPERVERLLAIAKTATWEERDEILAAAFMLSEHIAASRKVLERFRAVPSDADADCRCADATRCTLPDYVAVQAADVNLSS